MPGKSYINIIIDSLQTIALCTIVAAYRFHRNNGIRRDVKTVLPIDRYKFDKSANDQTESGTH